MKTTTDRFPSPFTTDTGEYETDPSGDAPSRDGSGNLEGHALFMRVSLRVDSADCMHLVSTE